MSWTDLLELMWRLAGYPCEAACKPEPPDDNIMYWGGNLPTVEVVGARGLNGAEWTKIVHKVLSDRVGEEHVVALYLAFRQYGDQIDRHFCYILATAWHECRFRPGPERRAHPLRQPRLWRLQERYWPSGYYGRGYVQLTWRKNYERFSKILKKDLVGNPDLVNLPEIGAAVTVIGMTEGYFTGRNLSYYLDESPPDWVNARRVVNGLDKAKEIAATAQRLYHEIKQHQS